MFNFFARQAVAYRNRLRQECGTLHGIIAGLLADRILNDDEIRFLSSWLERNDAIAAEWPGDVLAERLRVVLADGRVTEDERQHLVETLSQIIGGSLERLTESGPVNQLAFDSAESIAFQGSTFCLTGEFVYGPRPKCVAAVTERGGAIINAVTKRLHYLVVGTLGSPEWKHGSFGTKIERAIAYKRAGVPLQILREDRWSSALRAAPG